MAPTNDGSSRELAAPLLHETGSLDDERRAMRQIWNEFVERTKQSPIDRTNFVQAIASVFFLIFTLVGTCHFGRPSVCFIEPYISNFLPLAVAQLALNATYLFWPDVPERYLRTKLPVAGWLLLAAAWSLELLVAGMLLLEGMLLGSSYHHIHIPRFILSVIELICTYIIAWQTFRFWLRVRGTNPHLPR